MDQGGGGWNRMEHGGTGCILTFCVTVNVLGNIGLMR